MDALASDRFCPNEHGLFRWIFDELVHRGDRYYHIADFPAYVETQALIDSEYLDEEIWWRKAILNVARIGKFSSDRTVTEYARDIWHIGQFEKGEPREDPGPHCRARSQTKAGACAATTETCAGNRRETSGGLRATADCADSRGWISWFVILSGGGVAEATRRSRRTPIISEMLVQDIADCIGSSTALDCAQEDKLQ